MCGKDVPHPACDDERQKRIRPQRHRTKLARRWPNPSTDHTNRKEPNPKKHADDQPERKMASRIFHSARENRDVIPTAKTPERPKHRGGKPRGPASRDRYFLA